MTVDSVGEVRAQTLKKEQVWPWLQTVICYR